MDVAGKLCRNLGPARGVREPRCAEIAGHALELMGGKLGGGEIIRGERGMDHAETFAALVGNAREQRTQLRGGEAFAQLCEAPIVEERRRLVSAVGQESMKWRHEYAVPVQRQPENQGAC